MRQQNKAAAIILKLLNQTIALNSKNYIVLLVFIIVTGTACKKEAVSEPSFEIPLAVLRSSTFTNPLLPVGPDPWIVQKDSVYYYLNTIRNKIDIRKTKAVSLLAYARPVTVWAAPSTGPTSHNIWAPELHYFNGKWSLYFTAGSTPEFDNQRLYVIENDSDDPTTGEWTAPKKLKDSGADYFAIDATTFNYNDNRYIIYSGHPSKNNNSQYLYIAKIGDDNRLTSARVEISRPSYSWEKIGGTPYVNEGPEILVNKAGRVFLIYSASGCWTDDYGLAMLTLKEDGDPLNPSHWTKSKEPVFTKSAVSNAFGPGHCGFFKTIDGKEDWIIYHANSGPNQGCGDTRSPRMQRFTWKEDGTPDFGTPLKTLFPVTKPSGEWQ